MNNIVLFSAKFYKNINFPKLKCLYSSGSNVKSIPQKDECTRKSRFSLQSPLLMTHGVLCCIKRVKASDKIITIKKYFYCNDVM